MQLYLIYTLLLALANAAPLPAVVTKVVTADAVTVTNTEVALTTITIPVEEIIIIGDNTITTTFTTLTQFAPTEAIPTAITTTHSNGVIELVGNGNVAGDATAATSTATGSTSGSSGSGSDSGSDSGSNDADTITSSSSSSSSSSSVTTTSQQTAPTTIALTTTTIPSQSVVAPDANATLNLTTTNGKAILPTLTEGLQKDTAVAPTMQNPQTVSVTNSSVASLTSSILSQAATATPSTTSTSASSISSSSSSSSSSSGTASTAASSNTSVSSLAASSESSSNSSSSSGASGTSVASASSSSASTLETSSSISSTTTSTAAAAATSSASSDDTEYLSKIPYAVVYSPYTSTQACKSYSDVFADISLIASKGVSQLRIYGNDCNYLTTVLPIASQFGLSVNQGFWISADGVDSIDVAVQNFIDYTVSDAAGYDWSLFEYFTIGNEAVLAGYCTVDELIAKISEVKGMLVSAGYTGLVTTAEPPVTFENNPELCTDSEIDFVGINPHSYFAPTFSAETSGSFVAAEAQIVQNLCGGKSIVVTETGYPHAGDVNGNNVPSPENQRIALQSIFDVYGTHVTILTAFDDLWKQPGQYGIEQSFGMLNWLEDTN